MIIKKCEVCESNNLKKVLNLGSHPLCDDLIKVGSKQKSRMYKIEILFCKKCFTAHQKYQVNKKILFHKNYHYRSRFTNDVINGMKNLVEESMKFFSNARGKTVLDIGCNDGSLLNFFWKKGFRTIGVEPTNSFKDANKKHKIFNNYFDRNLVNQLKKKKYKIDLICFTNVFAHIQNLNELLKNLKTLIDKDTVLIIENHYLGSVLKKNQFDTFYHEHPRTYSLKSFNFIAKTLNVNILKVQFPKRYGGNIRVILGRRKTKESNKVSYLISKEKKFIKGFQKMNTVIKNWKIKKFNQVKKLYLKNGKLIAKGYPGRAAILIKLLNLNENYISAVYEKPKSKKIGYYVPGTKIPILSDNLLFKKINQRKIDIIINLAWHISKEIKNYLRSKKYKKIILDIL